MTIGRDNVPLSQVNFGVLVGWDWSDVYINRGDVVTSLVSLVHSVKNVPDHFHGDIVTLFSSGTVLECFSVTRTGHSLQYEPSGFLQSIMV